MTSDSSSSDSEQPGATNPLSRRVNSNQMVLDLRQQLQQQERIIRSLIVERDSLTRELDSRLFLVEAQLRREQKHIEMVLTEKEHLIQFQAMQIHSLKQLLSQFSQNQIYYQRNHGSSKSLLTKRYSVALDEYMKDHCIVSRALPVMVQGENETNVVRHPRCSRTRSLPELRFEDNVPECYHLPLPNCRDVPVSHQKWCHEPLVVNSPAVGATSNACYRILPDDVIDDMTNRRGASDCDSEHSDSLDSGISSPSITSRNIHEEFRPVSQDLYYEEQKTANRPVSASTSNSNTEIRRVQGVSEPEFLVLESVNQKPRRSSSIGNFINRTFSSSSSLEKMKDNQESSARRHSSFSGTETKSLAEAIPVQKARFISSANRTFGTNHRSVTKPRDIKFRKLFKFRRRTEPEVVNGEDYMTV